MSFADLLHNKPVLVGLHLAFAIVGIDFFLWLMGEFIANPEKRSRIKFVSIMGLLGFVLSWLAGGYYYVKYYGTLVKPVILAGSADWAHKIAMEAKEHIFLFIIPMAMTLVFLAFLDKETLNNSRLKGPAITLIGVMVSLALAIGAMGYIISAAARWAL